MQRATLAQLATRSRGPAAGALVLSLTLAGCHGQGGDADAGASIPLVGPLVGNVDFRTLFGGAGATQEPQVVADEDVTVAPRAWHGPGFTLPSPRTVHVVAEGKQHADKGFKIYVMASDEIDKFEKRKAFKDVPAFEGLKVHSLDRTETLPAGSWCVVVHNSENAAHPILVHLRVVVSAP